MAGIKETKEVLDFTAAIGNATGVSLQDGKFDLMEITNYITALTKLPSAVDGIDQVPEELKDLYGAEAQEILAFFSEKLDLPQEEIETAVEDHLAVGLAFYRLVQKYYWKPAA